MGITEPPLLSVDSSTPAFLEMGGVVEVDASEQRSTDVLAVQSERGGQIARYRYATWELKVTALRRVRH